VILIGSGIMSANLGAMLKRLEPRLKIQLYEVTAELAQESSRGWNNAGTGHAGLCELSYTPNREADGTVAIAKVLEICEQFERSKQFWSYAVETGMADKPREFINPVPHLSFVHGAEMVARATRRCPRIPSSGAWSTRPIGRPWANGRHCWSRAARPCRSRPPGWTKAPT
jgi:malate dehydrogenase (quinone)